MEGVYTHTLIDFCLGYWKRKQDGMMECCLSFVRVKEYEARICVFSGFFSDIDSAIGIWFTQEKISYLFLMSHSCEKMSLLNYTK